MNKKIIEVIYEVLKPEKVEIDADTDLSEIGLTSISLINVIVELEDRLDFEFNDDDLLLENLNTVRKIEECIENSINET